MNCCGPEISHASEKDCPALAEIDSASKTAAGWGLSDFERELKEPRAVLLAAKPDGKPIGFIAARILPPEVQLLNLAVGPDSERRGIGGKLLAALSEIARSSGCSAMTLEVCETNSAAKSFYLKNGFRVVGLRPKFYNGKDAVLMDLKL